MFEAYITNTALYPLMGIEVGTTVHFPMTTQELQAALAKIGIDGKRYSEVFFTSFDSDVVLSTLSRGMINRRLFKVEVTSSSITKTRKEEILSRISKQLNINKKEAKYFLSISSIENNMYKKEDDSIEIIYKDGSTRDIAKASDMLNISLLSRKVKKYYICYLRSENDGH